MSPKVTFGVPIGPASRERRCDVDLSELDGGNVFVEVSGVGYDLQWTAPSPAVLRQGCELLAAAPSLEGWDQVELGSAFETGRVLLVADESVVRFRVLGKMGDGESTDLVEVALRDEDRRALLDELTTQLGDL